MPLVTASASAGRVRVTPDGRVGIGTAEPAEPLDVAGAVRARGVYSFAAGYAA